MKCSPELFEALDRTFAPGTFTERDCNDATMQQLERFGIFRTERPGYDRETGSNRDEGRNYLANLHNIWQASFEVGDDGLADKTKPIPIKDRLPKPIVYHLSVGFPEDLTEANVQVMKDWNAAGDLIDWIYVEYYNEKSPTKSSIARLADTALAMMKFKVIFRDCTNYDALAERYAYERMMEM